MAEDPYDVGYGKPPLATRFAKGKSGNPRGRPKGSRSLAAQFAAILDERVTVTENGKRRTITKREAALKQVANRAAAGDAKATRMLLDLVQAAEARPAEAGADLGPEDDLVMQELMRRIAGAQS